MITLFQFHRVWNLPNSSPFCMKVETYLRMAGLPYENKFVNNPQKGPKRKLPYIKMDGVFYSDSEFIIDELKLRFGDGLDKDLTAEQKATAVLVDLAFCERLYWVMVYLRWQDDAGWNILRKTMFGKIPFFAQVLVSNTIRKNMLKELDYQGIGRHNLTEVLKLGYKMLDIISGVLGEKNYFLGNKPSSLDATAFAFLANIIWTPLNDPLKHHALKLGNLETYCTRMWDEYYADMPRTRVKK